MDRPVEFCEDMVLQLTEQERNEDKLMRRLEPESKAIMNAVAHHRFTSVHSGHGVTKTFSICQLILWFLFTRKDARIFVTGPKFDQLKLTLWAELNKWLKTSLLYDQLIWSAEKCHHVDNPGSWFAALTSAREAENIAGFHAEHLLILIDEASGVEDKIYTVLRGCLTRPDNHILITGNPTKTSGFFFDSWNKNSDFWYCLHFSSEKSAMVDKTWLSEMQRDWPRESDVYRVRVLGLPPQGNPKSIISLSDCEDARMREIDDGDFIELGVDPASEGNDLTTIAIRIGYALKEVRIYSKTKAHETIAYILETVREYRSKTGIKSKVRIKVDDTGYGNAIRQTLALNTTDNIEVVPCLFGGQGNEQYGNYATVMWFGFRDIIHMVSLPEDRALIEELSAREFNVTEGNKIKVEPKKIYKARLGRSPDRADAVVLCFADGDKKVFAENSATACRARQFEVDWLNQYVGCNFTGPHLIESLHIGSLVLNRDLTFCGLAAVYEFIRDHLWIYTEYFQETPVPEMLIQTIKIRSKLDVLRDGRAIRFFGGPELYKTENTNVPWNSSARRPLADVLRQGGLYVMEPVQYDGYGAIALGAQMFNHGTITINEPCIRAREQVNLWAVKNANENDSKTGFCRALLIILSEVRRQQRYRSTGNEYYKSKYSDRPWDYRDVKIEQKREDPSWMAR